VDVLIHALGFLKEPLVCLNVTLAFLYLCVDYLPEILHLAGSSCPWSELMRAIIVDGLFPAARFEQFIFWAALFPFPLNDTLKSALVDRFVEYLQRYSLLQLDSTPCFQFTESNPMVHCHPFWNLQISAFCRLLFPDPVSLPHPIQEALAPFLS
jgi:hypothetical protein